VSGDGADATKPEAVDFLRQVMALTKKLTGLLEEVQTFRKEAAEPEAAAHFLSGVGLLMAAAGEITQSSLAQLQALKIEQFVKDL